MVARHCDIPIAPVITTPNDSIRDSDPDIYIKS